MYGDIYDRDREYYQPYNERYSPGYPVYSRREIQQTPDKENVSKVPSPLPTNVNEKLRQLPQEKETESEKAMRLAREKRKRKEKEKKRQPKNKIIF